MVWHDVWLVGVRVIDEQTRHLVSLLNQLHQAMSVGKGKEALPDCGGWLLPAEG